MTKISNQYSLTNVLTADPVNGRVGVNNASPTVALDVTGAARVSGASTFNGAVTIGNDLGTALTIGRFSPSIPIAYMRASASSTGGFRLTNHNGLDVIVVDGSNNITLDGPVTNITGKLGIGTTTIGTDFKLAVYGTNSLMAFQNANTGQTNGDGLIVGSFGNVDGYLFNYENANIIFGTNATERMRITSGGAVLINTTVSNNYPLNIESFAGGSCIYLKRVGANGQIAIGGTTSGGSLVFISANDTGGVQLTNGATSWTSASDERLKNINSNIEDAVSKLSLLRAVNFSWKYDETQKEVLGLIAQDVESVLPQVIDITKDGFLGVRYTELVPVLVKAIQELSAQASEQQTQINELKALLNA